MKRGNSTFLKPLLEPLLKPFLESFLEPFQTPFFSAPFETFLNAYLLAFFHSNAFEARNVWHLKFLLVIHFRPTLIFQSIVQMHDPVNK